MLNCYTLFTVYFTLEKVSSLASITLLRNGEERVRSLRRQRAVMFIVSCSLFLVLS